MPEKRKANSPCESLKLKQKSIPTKISQKTLDSSGEFESFESFENNEMPELI